MAASSTAGNMALFGLPPPGATAGMAPQTAPQTPRSPVPPGLPNRNPMHVSGPVPCPPPGPEGLFAPQDSATPNHDLFDPMRTAGIDDDMVSSTFVPLRDSHLYLQSNIDPSLYTSTAEVNGDMVSCIFVPL